MPYVYNVSRCIWTCIKLSLQDDTVLEAVIQPRNTLFILSECSTNNAKLLYNWKKANQPFSVSLLSDSNIKCANSTIDRWQRQDDCSLQPGIPGTVLIWASADVFGSLLSSKWAWFLNLSFWSVKLRTLWPTGSCGAIIIWNLLTQERWLSG